MEPAGGAGQTLDPTSLVHEAFARLVEQGTIHWKSRAHFFGAAAIAMRRGLAQLNTQLGHKLQMRIAISTGTALTGDIGSPRRREFTVLGDVVNTASRIEDEVAKPGEIVVSEETWKRVKGRVHGRAVPPVTLRGRSTPSKLYAIED